MVCALLVTLYGNGLGEPKPDEIDRVSNAAVKTGSHVKTAIAFIAADVIIVPVIIALLLLRQYWRWPSCCVCLCRGICCCYCRCCCGARRSSSGASATATVPAGGTAYAPRPRETGACEGHPCLVCAQISGLAADADDLDSAAAPEDAPSTDVVRAAQLASSRVIPPNSVFAWVRGKKLPPGSASRFVAEYLAVLWFAAGVYALFGALVEFFFAADTVPGLLVHMALFGQTPSSHMTPMGIFALHTLDTQCDDILQLARPSPLRRRWWSCTRRNCGCSKELSEWLLDAARHWGTGWAIWLASQAAVMTFMACTTDELHAPVLCDQWVGPVRIVLNSLLGLYTVTISWSFRTHVLQAALTRMVTVVMIATTVVGFGLILVLPGGVIAIGNSFLIGIAWGILFPGCAYVLMLWEDSSRVDALTQFLQYMTHQVRGPSRVAAKALRRIRRRLAVFDTDMDKLPAATVHALHGAIGGTTPLAGAGGATKPAATAATAGTRTPRSSRSEPLVAAPQHAASSLSQRPVSAHVRARSPPAAQQYITLESASDAGLSDGEPLVPPVESQLPVPANSASAGSTRRQQSTSKSAHSGESGDVFVEPGQQQPDTLQIARNTVQSFVTHAKRRIHDMQTAAQSADASLSAVTALLDRTLDLARLEAGHGGVQPSRFQVSALWSDVVRAVAPAYRESGVRLHFKVGDVAVTADRRVAFPSIWQSQAAASTWVLGDRLRLHQSLVALLDNGARYTPRGGHVRVSLDVMSLSAGSDLGALGITQEVPHAPSSSGGEQQPTGLRSSVERAASRYTVVRLDDSPSNGSHTPNSRPVHKKRTPFALRVTVSDTGRGIEAAHLARLFLPFARLHAEGSGTGLGLNIAKRAMRAHGGDVRVASGGAGQGSTFTLSALLYGADVHSSDERDSFVPNGQAQKNGHSSTRSVTALQRPSSSTSPTNDVAAQAPAESKPKLGPMAAPKLVLEGNGTGASREDPGADAAAMSHLWRSASLPFTRSTFAARAGTGDVGTPGAADARSPGPIAPTAPQPHSGNHLWPTGSSAGPGRPRADSARSRTHSRTSSGRGVSRSSSQRSKS